MTKPLVWPDLQAFQPASSQMQLSSDASETEGLWLEVAGQSPSFALDQTSSSDLPKAGPCYRVASMMAGFAISILAATVFIAALVNLALAGAAISLNGLQLLRRMRTPLVRTDSDGLRAHHPAEHFPFVSIHVAAHNEPPELVIDTLNALARLDYPLFEVILIDNNTADPAAWLPVKAHVDQLGLRFRFLHRRGVIGAKAGALNIALEHADPATRFVAIVDADYQVTPDFLSAALAAFHDDIQFVQFPQAYRHSSHATMVANELSDYFRTFPTVANRSGASLLTGTLSVISLKALRGVGGWPTGSITEDAELGVALWKAGAQGLYVDQVVGRGLLPLDLAGLRIQRSRWVTGNIQTLLSALGDWSLFRQRAGKLAVAAQLTAWSGFLALPLLVLGLLAGLRLLWPDIHAQGGELWLWSQYAATLTIMISLIGLALRAMSNDSPSTLAVMLSLLWTSSFCWVPLLLGQRPRFRRTPKDEGSGKAGLSADDIAAICSMAFGAYFAASGSPVTGLVLVLAASSLITGPMVNQRLRDTFLQNRAQPCEA